LVGTQRAYALPAANVELGAPHVFPTSSIGPRTFGIFLIARRALEASGVGVGRVIRIFEAVTVFAKFTPAAFPIGLARSQPAGVSTLLLNARFRF
jgi:hypothetical protein